MKRQGGTIALVGCLALASVGCASGPGKTLAAQSGSRAIGGSPATAASTTEPFTDTDRRFELDTPGGGAWALATDVTSPDGHAIPVVVAHPASGAQMVVQVSEPVDSVESLASMLHDRLEAEASLQVGKPSPVTNDAGSSAYGFSFKLDGEANGRVAVIDLGQQVILVVASWPAGADQSVVDDIDGMVKSVRLPAGADPAMLRPDKA